MQDWNVVVTVCENEFAQACMLLRDYGNLSTTHFFNVLALKVNDTQQFLLNLQEQVETNPSLLEVFGHIIPVTTTFVFQSPEEFEAKSQNAITPWVPQLAEKTFHIRMHRRGFKGRLSSQNEERFLDEFLLACLEKSETKGEISFDDPDIIITIETIGQWAGLSLWNREDRQRYPILHLN